MAVASSPADFEGGAEAPDGSAWELFGERFETNPKHLLGEGDFEMLRFWRLYQVGHLPEDGGVMRQAAVMLEAFDVMTAAERDLRDEQVARSRARARARRSSR